MTNIALIAVLTVVLLLLLYLFFMNRRATRLRTVADDVEAELAVKLRRDAEITGGVVAQLTGGIPTDQVVTEYQRERASVLVGDRTDKPWAWDQDELDRWRKRELRRRAEDVNRQLIVPAIASSLLVLAVAAVAITVTYNFLAPEQFDQVAEQDANIDTDTLVPTYDPLAFPTAQVDPVANDDLSPSPTPVTGPPTDLPASTTTVSPSPQTTPQGAAQ